MNAICVFQDKKIKGKIRFTQEKREKPVQIELELQGFPKKKKPSDYAIHIHEFGDLSNGCMSTGGHFNPYDKIHGIIHPEYHIGDFISNITPNQNGDVFFQRNEPLLSLFPDEENCILGRSIVIHEYPDDLGDWKKYKTMGEKELLEFVLKRGYIKKKKDFKKEEMVEYCIEQSKKTGNAGGRMVCAIIGLLP